MSTDWESLSCGHEGHERETTMCGECEGVWCDACDPAHGPLCPWCHGRGYSSARLREPRYRQANHVHPADRSGGAL